MKTKLIIVFAFILFAASCKSSKSSLEENEMIEISANFTTTKSYCGGAPPSQEILNQLKTPRPFPNATFYIKKGSINTLSTPIFKEVKTDMTGSFKIVVPKGDYLILNDSQINDDVLNDKMEDIRITDQKKLNKWWSNGIYKVSGNNVVLDTTFHKKCDIPLAVPYLKFNGLPRPGRR